MEKYFCKACLGLWKNDKYMICCPGCVAHRDTGWLPTTLLETYGPMFKVADKAYFPTIARPFPAPTRLSPQRILSQVYHWIQQQGFLQGFVEQQTHFLHQYEKHGTVEWWNAIDPIVQQYFNITF